MEVNTISSPVVVKADSLLSLQNAWEVLLGSATINTIFLTPLWLQVWWEHFGKGYGLCLLSLQKQNQLAGIAPLMINDAKLSFHGDTDLVDYHDFIVKKGEEPDFYTLLWEQLKDEGWSTLDLKSLPEGSPTLSILPEMAERDGFKVTIEEEDKAPIALLPPTWDGYLQSLDRKDRHELRRKLRRIESAGQLRYSVYRRPEDVTSLMPDFFRLFRASSQQKLDFLTPQREQFFVDLSGRMAHRDYIRMAVLELQETLVAVSLSFSYAGAWLLYNSGYDPQYAHLSVGLLNKAMSIGQAIEEGCHSFDFLRGRERYKYELGGVDRTIYHLTICR